MAKQPNSDDRVMAMLPHLLSIFTGFIGPLIIYLIIKDDKKKNKYVIDNAKHSLNFQISLVIYSVALIILLMVSVILSVLLIGIPFTILFTLLLFVLGIFALVFEIIASVKAYQGEIYKYPLEIPFIK